MTVEVVKFPQGYTKGNLEYLSIMDNINPLLLAEGSGLFKLMLSCSKGRVTLIRGTS